MKATVICECLQMKLGLMDFFNYLMNSENSRCITEGEAVLNAGHVILCGRSNFDPEKIEIYALCLQTSALLSEPHQIHGHFENDDSRIIIGSFLCSCKAGRSGKCKHISAVLVICTRTNIEELEHVSQTDAKCVWATQKHSTREKYKAVPLEDMPCFSGRYVEIPEVEDEGAVLGNYMASLPISSLAMHRAGRRHVAKEHEIFMEENPDTTTILNWASQSILMLELSTIPMSFENDCCRENYHSRFRDVDGLIQLKQHSASWVKERKFRVTGSRVYELYTFSKTDWEMKALKYFCQKNISNKYIRHGLRFEREAREQFASSFKVTVVECGLIVSNSNPWLAFSPDGIIFDNGNPSALLEIKCIYSGATQTIEEAIRSASFLDMGEGGMTLKKRHKYYGQIQMGMALSNIDLCYFVVYASYDKSFISIPIKYDANFTQNMLIKVKHIFFNYMWHHSCTIE